MIPAWILDAFAAIMLAVAAVSAARLVAARAWSQPAADADIDVAHVLMGIAMAGMLTGALRTLPNAAWAAIFAVVTVWFGLRVAAEAARRRISDLSASHHLPHLVHGAAMVYMFAAFRTPSGATGSATDGGMAMSAGSMGSLRLPELGLVFVLVMTGWVAWDLNQLTGPAGSPSAGSEAPARARSRRNVVLATAGTLPALPAEAGPIPAPVADHEALAAASAEPGVSGPAAGDPVTGVLLGPQVATGSRIAMGITMALMLILLI